MEIRISLSGFHAHLLQKIEQLIFLYSNSLKRDYYSKSENDIM